MQQVMVRVPPELYAEIQAMAAEEDRTTAQTIRRAMREYLERRRAK
jgi:predicted transcriptional regulator